MTTRFFALLILAIPAASGCGTSTSPSEEVLTEHQSLSLPSQQNVSVATDRQSMPIATREAQRLSAEEAQTFFKGPTPSLGPPPTLQDAFAAIQSASGSSNMGDLVREYLRAVAQLPVEQQQAARQRLRDYLANTTKAH
jgi:hypothetical protein